MSSEKQSDNSNSPSEKVDEPKVSEEFLKDIAKHDLPEEKIRYCLDQMRLNLSQDTTPRFREFWEIRKYCLPFFKENISSFVRSSLWKEFIELTEESRRLKGILDEQASFTTEQIDLAISGLEKEISEYDDIVEKSQKLKLPKTSKVLAANLDKLADIQREVNLLSTIIQRVNDLRKELISTEMRVRFKNKFFKRLNSLGDFLFPKRKLLIQKLSEIFLDDVKKFHEKHLQSDSIKIPFFAFRDEIKSIQAVSKILTLSNKAFSEARTLLSACWDKVKELESEKRKEFEEKKETFEENKIKVIEKIDEIAQKSESYNYEQIEKELNEILKFMRTVELGRDDVKELKERLQNIKAPFEEERKKAEELRLKLEKEALEKKRQELADIKAEIAKTFDLNDYEKVKHKVEDFEKRLSEFKLTKYEKQMLEKDLKPLKDYQSDLKEQEMIASLSDDEIKSLEKLKSLLDERKKRKKVIKSQLEAYRKELGSSGFDFEKAMMVRDLIDGERLRLEKAEEGISEIENKIAEIEGR
ncbi:MAG: hypothetical protein COT84_07455 [Chlamydiae bacterium CG10_big_fil_rev_8_21_14_0_10_35_9]|nr:MAG: hypothetical protein COT84_07455 [Chlamydiae bacterium CG10_big_fil_rev_8_21_14_0_10_35_9]